MNRISFSAVRISWYYWIGLEMEILKWIGSDCLFNVAKGKRKERLRGWIWRVEKWWGISYPQLGGSQGRACHVQSAQWFPKLSLPLFLFLGKYIYISPFFVMCWILNIVYSRCGSDFRGSNWIQQKKIRKNLENIFETITLIFFFLDSRKYNFKF